MNEKNIKYQRLNTFDDIDTFPINDTRKSQLRFRLAGAPSGEAIKLISIDLNLSILEIKMVVKKEYNLNPIVRLQFICKGIIFSDKLKFNNIRSGINPNKDVILVMGTQTGAGKIEMKCIQCETMNINEILVCFIAEDELGNKYEDTTTLPKFLYYLEHPSDKRGYKNFQPVLYKVNKVKHYCCSKCYNNQLVEKARRSRIKNP